MGRQRGQEARGQILEELRRRGSMTIDAIADASRLSKTATRAHLLRLEEDGLIAREEQLATRGRPPVAYRLTVEGGAVFPTRDADLLARLLEFLDAEGANDLVERFFEGIWAKRREQLAPGETLEARIDALEDLLSASDFMPAIELIRADGAKRVRVRECNCPLPAAVRATKIPCRLEAQFLADALGGRLAHSRVASDRSETCLFEVELDPDASMTTPTINR